MAHKPQPLPIQPKRKPQPQGKSDYKFSKNPDEFPCSVCGEKDFEWGHWVGQVGYSQKRLPMFKSRALHARVCLACGNVMAFLRD